MNTPPFDDPDADPPAWVAGISRDATPPPALQARVVASLRAQGMIRPEPRFRLAKMALAAAAAAALVGTGWLAGRGGTPGIDDQGPRFVLLLYGGAALPSQEGERVREYREWAVARAREGRHVTGERLARDGAVFGARIDEQQAAPAGFFVVSARSDSDAAALAAGHPHVRHGGTVVVRRIEPGR